MGDKEKQEIIVPAKDTSQTSIMLGAQKMREVGIPKRIYSKEYNEASVLTNARTHIQTALENMKEAGYYIAWLYKNTGSNLETLYNLCEGAGIPRRAAVSALMQAHVTGGLKILPEYVSSKSEGLMLPEESQIANLMDYNLKDALQTQKALVQSNDQLNRDKVRLSEKLENASKRLEDKEATNEKLNAVNRELQEELEGRKRWVPEGTKDKKLSGYTRDVRGKADILSNLIISVFGLIDTEDPQLVGHIESLMCYAEARLSESTSTVRANLGLIDPGAISRASAEADELEQTIVQPVIKPDDEVIGDGIARVSKPPAGNVIDGNFHGPK